MRLTLTRIEMTDEYTLGLLHLGRYSLATVEQPWNDNVPFKSCVPVGFYHLAPHDGTKYRKTWALVGEHVSAQEEMNVARYTCVLHVANAATEVQGCIAPGMSHKAGAVVYSRPAMDALRGVLGWSDQPHYLTIREELRE